MEKDDTMIEENRRIRREINERGRQAAGFLKYVGSLLWSRELPRRCKRIIYKTYYVPILTYGAKTWVMKNRDKSRMQACDMRFLRSSIGIT